MVVRGAIKAREGDTLGTGFQALGLHVGVTQADVPSLVQAFQKLNPGKGLTKREDTKGYVTMYLQPGETYLYPTKEEVQAILAHNAEAAAAALAEQKPQDEVVQESRPASSITGAVNDRIANLENRLAGLERENTKLVDNVNNLKRENKELRTDIDNTSETLSARIQQDEIDRVTPSFLGTAFEGGEFLARCFLPFVNLLSALRTAFDVLRNLWQVFKEGKDFEARTLIRLGADVIGIMPGMGWVPAVTDQVVDFWDSSEGKGTKKTRLAL